MNKRPIPRRKLITWLLWSLLAWFLLALITIFRSGKWGLSHHNNEEKKLSNLWRYKVLNGLTLKVDKTGKKQPWESYQTKYFLIPLEKAEPIEMVWIPQGSFQMGSTSDEWGHNEDESPRHSVNIKSFNMSRFSITQSQWKSVVKLPAVNRNLPLEPSTFSGGDLPIETISWEEAVEFCHRLSQEWGGVFRLPTEAEWEYACRAQTQTPFYFGETITADLANYNSVNQKYGLGPQGMEEQFIGKTTPVKTFNISNSFGLMEMYGNLWEWCLDYYYPHYKGAPIDGSARLNPPDSSFPERVIRGGAWYSFPIHCRSASRDKKSQNFASNGIGFRIVWLPNS